MPLTQTACPPANRRRPAAAAAAIHHPAAQPAGAAPSVQHRWANRFGPCSRRCCTAAHPGSSRLRQASLTGRRRRVRASTWVRGPLLSGGRTARSAESVAALPPERLPVPRLPCRRGAGSGAAGARRLCAARALRLRGRPLCVVFRQPRAMGGNTGWSPLLPPRRHRCLVLLRCCWRGELSGLCTRVCLRLDIHKQNVGLLSRCPYRPPAAPTHHRHRAPCCPPPSCALQASAASAARSGVP